MKIQKYLGRLYGEFRDYNDAIFAGGIAVAFKQRCCQVDDFEKLRDGFLDEVKSDPLHKVYVGDSPNNLYKINPDLTVKKTNEQVVKDSLRYLMNCETHKVRIPPQFIVIVGSVFDSGPAATIYRIPKEILLEILEPQEELEEA